MRQLDAYKEITQDYSAYLNGGSASLSSWRNFFTGFFYHGKHARYFLRDLFAGGVKNNFFFKLFPKAEHANFIALIDRIVKLDHNPTTILNSVSESKTEEQLLNHLIQYFMDLQEKTPIESQNDSYHATMKALKRDINDFARDCSIAKRIKFGVKQCYVVINSRDEAKKIHTRQIKSRLKAFSKVAAWGMGFTEIFIALAGLAAIFATPFTGLLFLQVLVGTCGFYFGYLFAKEDLYQLTKTLYLGRVFQKKNKTTGEYVELGPYQIAAIIVLSPFSIVAGFCIASIACTSLLGALPVMGTATFIPALFLVTAFVFCLATSTFFLTIKHVISEINRENLCNYANSLKQHENENGFKYAARLVLEGMTRAFALVTMSVVAIAGYFLFKDKCTHMLKTFWAALSAINVDMIARAVSFSYSSIKLVFGSKKIMNIISSIESYFSAKRKGTSDTAPLNPLQRQAQIGSFVYMATGLGFAGIRAFTNAGFYRETAITNALPLPDVVGETAFVFSYAINGDPFLKSQRKQTAEPLPTRRMS